MTTNFEDVRDFHERFGLINNLMPVHLTRRKLLERIQFMQEELNEFVAGSANQDLAAQADALIDLVYVALGTAVQLGLPWDALWNDVHACNMNKVRGTGKRGHQVDVIKPDGWQGPRTAAILNDHGYDAIVHSQEEYHCDDNQTQTSV